VRPLRRSSRNAKRPNYQVDSDVSSYPDDIPINALEYLIASLNMESFPTEIYAAADDVVVYSLFATKSRLSSYRALIPVTISGPLGMSISDGIAIAKICKHHIDREDPTVESCAAAVISFRKSFPRLFSRFEDRLLIQWVSCQQVDYYHSIQYMTFSAACFVDTHSYIHTARWLWRRWLSLA
jgi:hypothetical protein